MPRAITLRAHQTDSGKRLDHLLQERLPEYSRSRLQSWIKDGRVLINARPAKSSATVRGGETIAIEPAGLAPLRALPEAIPLDVLYEDAGVIAINKPAGMTVHAGPGQHSGTLVNALLHRFETLSTVGGDLRPGIVHRLDRYTSGVILVARTDRAHRAIAEQFAKRTTSKTYLALASGPFDTNFGRIAAPITRDPIHRTRMTARLASGRAALTEYRVLERFPAETLLEVAILTGRTHQIRVHLASIGHPVVGDKLYGARPSTLGRYFLHAWRLAFTTPDSGERVTIEAPLAPELTSYLDGLRGPPRI